MSRDTRLHQRFEVVGFNHRSDVLDMVRKDGHSGIVVNPAGPSIAFSAPEIAGDSQARR